MSDIKTIDFHTHIFPSRLAALTITKLEDNVNSSAFFDGTVDGLVKDMEKNNVDISVCMPIASNPRHTIKINDYAISINNDQEKYKNIYSFASLHPDYIDIDNELKRLKENGIKGIKLHPVYQQVPVDDERFVLLIQKILANGFYCTIHAGLDPGFPDCDYACVKRLVRVINQLNDTSHLILAHLGGLFEWEEVLETIAGKDLYLDTAMTFDKIIKRDSSTVPLIQDDLFKKILIRHGSEKILFGSDNPWTSSLINKEYILSLDISETDKENILYKNALKILEIEE